MLLAQSDKPQGVWGTGPPVQKTLPSVHSQLANSSTAKLNVTLNQYTLGARFNRGHEVIAEMEAHFDRVWTLTQNVDGFHRQAGSKNVIDVHGDMHELHCTACEFRRTVRGFTELSIPPRCPDCEAILRPDVVLFGEMLPTEKVERLYRELAAGFDVVFTVGTSSVFPYIAEPALRASHLGVPTVEINPGSSDVSSLVDVKLAMGAAKALDVIWRRYQETVE